MSVAVLHQLRNYFCVWSHKGHTPSWAPSTQKAAQSECSTMESTSMSWSRSVACDYMALSARAHHSARASSEPKCKNYCTWASISQLKLIKLAWYKVMQSIIVRQIQTRLMNLNQISFLYHVVSELYTKNWKFCSYRYPREGHEEVISQQGRALLTLKTTHSPLLHKRRFINPKPDTQG